MKVNDKGLFPLSSEAHCGYTSLYKYVITILCIVHFFKKEQKYVLKLNFSPFFKVLKYILVNSSTVLWNEMYFFIYFFFFFNEMYDLCFFSRTSFWPLVTAVMEVMLITLPLWLESMTLEGMKDQNRYVKRLTQNSWGNNPTILILLGGMAVLFTLWGSE